MTRRHQTTGSVPHSPRHRRNWRTLWRRCICGLPAPCIDSRVPTAPLPFPPLPDSALRQLPADRSPSALEPASNQPTTVQPAPPEIEPDHNRPTTPEPSSPAIDLARNQPIAPQPSPPAIEAIASQYASPATDSGQNQPNTPQSSPPATESERDALDTSLPIPPTSGSARRRETTSRHGIYRSRHARPDAESSPSNRGTDTTPRSPHPESTIGRAGRLTPAQQHRVGQSSLFRRRQNHGR
jgi:hypothetical protein